jgi:predicted nucleotidyltransferase
MGSAQQSGRTVVEDFSRRVHATLGAVVRTVHWFGSRVRGEASADSDYDVLVETARPLTSDERDRILDITLDISVQHDCLMDVHYYTSAELHDPWYARTPFTDTVLTEAVAV